VREPLLHGRYRLLTQLGTGGFGAVHRAEDTQDHSRVVAIKQINLAGLTPQQVIEATDGFNREVSLLSTLSHPHLPHVYEHFTDPDHWYLVMDYIEGETLETYLEHNYTHQGNLVQMPLDEVLDIAMQLCSVLDYLHTREPVIIFRDVKPANIMRTATGKLYLIDFGIARHYKPGKLKDTLPFGSPGYAAPEQYGKAQTTPRSDIYSLGALLHMLLSGTDPSEHPFSFAPLRLYGESVTILVELVERMVMLDAAQRPASVHEVQVGLQHALDLQIRGRILPMMTTPPPPPPVPQGQTITTGSGLGQLQQVIVQRRQLQKQRQQYWSGTNRASRRKFVVGSLATLGALAVGVGGLSLVSNLPYHGPGSGPPVYTSMRNDEIFLSTSQLNSSATDGTPIQAVSWQSDEIGATFADDRHICVQPVDVTLDALPSQALLTMYKTPASITAMQGQPVIGNYLAFACGDTVYLWSNYWENTQSIHPLETRIPASERIPIRTLAWSSNGQYIAFPFARGVQVWNVDTKEHVSDLLLDEQKGEHGSSIRSLSWSPNNPYLSAACGDNSIVTWSVVGTVYRSSTLRANIIAWSPDGNWIATCGQDSTFITVTSGFAGLNIQQGTTVYQTQYTGHTAPPTALSWSPDSRYLVSGSASKEHNLHVWSPLPIDSTTGRPAQNSTTLNQSSANIAGHAFFTQVDNGKSVASVAWSLDTNELLVGTNRPLVIQLATDLL
jgi:serine/threonine protein kinase